MYSAGYREAVLDFYNNGHTYRETCREFQINSATLSSWIKLKRDNGNLEANYRGSEPKIDREKLKNYVDEHPDAYQYEIAEEFGCAQSTIGYNLKKIGYTCKKKLSDTKNRTP